MFGKNGAKKGDYRKISLDDFSDDESNDGGVRSSTPPRGALPPGAARSQQLMKQQDEGLEMLSQSADRLGQMSLQINEELGFQNKILHDMENDLEAANDDLDLVTKKTQEFIEFTGGEKNCVLIVALGVIALILFLLIIYT